MRCENGLGNGKKIDFRRVAVGHDAAVKDRRGAGDIGQCGGDHAAGTGFGCCHHQIRHDGAFDNSTGKLDQIRFVLICCHYSTHCKPSRQAAASAPATMSSAITP